MLNRKTILQLYNGEIYPTECIVPTNPKYKTSCSDIEVLHERLLALLNLENKNLVEDFRDAIESRDSQIQDATFCKGFSLGLRLTAEAILFKEDV